MIPLTKERHDTLKARMYRARERFSSSTHTGLIRRVEIWTAWCDYVVRRGGWPYDDEYGQERRNRILAAGGKAGGA